MRRAIADFWNLRKAKMVAFWRRLKSDKAERERLVVLILLIGLIVTILSTIVPGLWALLSDDLVPITTTSDPPAPKPPAVLVKSPPEGEKPKVKIDGFFLQNDRRYYVGPRYSNLPDIPAEGYTEDSKLCFRPTQSSWDKSYSTYEEQAVSELLKKASPSFDITLRNSSASKPEVLYGVGLERSSTSYKSIAGGGDSVTGTVVPVANTIYLRVAGDRPTYTKLDNPIYIAPGGFVRIVVNIMLAEEHPLITITERGGEETFSEANIPSSYIGRLQFEFGGGHLISSKSICIEHLW